MSSYNKEWLNVQHINHVYIWDSWLLKSLQQSRMAKQGIATILNCPGIWKEQRLHFKKSKWWRFLAWKQKQNKKSQRKFSGHQEEDRDPTAASQQAESCWLWATILPSQGRRKSLHPSTHREGIPQSNCLSHCWTAAGKLSWLAFLPFLISRKPHSLSLFSYHHCSQGDVWSKEHISTSWNWNCFKDHPQTYVSVYRGQRLALAPGG